MNSNRNLRFLKKVIYNLVLVSFAAFSFCGCISKMALDRNKGSLAGLSKPIGIFTLDTTNAYKPSYWPHVEAIGCVSSSSHKVKAFQVSKENFLQQASMENYREGTGYLISVDLDPGDYSLGNIFGTSNQGGLKGVFCFPVNARFTLTNGITYLGHVMMTNRQRTQYNQNTRVRKGAELMMQSRPIEKPSGPIEESSGPLFPLLQQGLSGFSGGTFDVTVTDKGDSDIKEFVSAYPLLKDVNITKAIMQK
jgi:hypothetical protein